MQPATAAKAVLRRAREWAKARRKYRRLQDSKSARASDIEKAKKAIITTSEELEKAVAEIEKVYTSARALARVRKQRSPGVKIPWDKVLKGVEAVAGAAGAALAPPSVSDDPNIIDAEVIEVGPTRRR